MVEREARCGSSAAIRLDQSKKGLGLTMPRQSKAESTADAKKADGLPVRIVIDVRHDTPRHYINYAEINSTPHEFTFLAGRIPAKFSSDQLQCAKESSTVIIPADIEILIPPSLIPGLIRALATQKDLYERKYGVTLVERGSAGTHD